MLKTLLKIRLKGLLSSMLKGGKKEKKAGIGKIILYVLLFLYVFGVIIGLAYNGFDSIYPMFEMYQLQWAFFALMAIIAILLSFIGSVFVAKQEIYDAKDNELLLSLPIKQSDILLSRVGMVLLCNYLYTSLIILPAYTVYIKYAGITVLQIVLFIITYIILPLFTLSLTCLFAWMIASCMRHVRNKNIFTIVSYLVFFGAYMYVVSQSGQYANYLMEQGNQIADILKKVVPPIYYMAIGMQDGNLLSYLIFVVCMVVPFVLVIKLLSHNFIKLTLTKPKVSKIKYVEKEMVQQSVSKALLIREWKHFSSNAMVVLNGSMGILFTIIGIGAFLFYGLPLVQEMKDSGINIADYKDIAVPIIIVALAYCTSMNMISCSSISLEGNRLWILKSLPVPTIDILNTKVFFHILLCAPAQMIFSLVVGITIGLDIISILLITIIPLLLIILVAIVGLLVNLWKPKFDWVNETAVVKQSASLLITMFGSMGFMILVICAYFIMFDNLMTGYQYCYVVLLLLVVLNGVCIVLLKNYGVKRFESFTG